MIKLFQNKAFIAGSLIGILSVVIVNIYTTFNMQCYSSSASQCIGFPFPFYERFLGKCESVPGGGADLSCYIWYFSWSDVFADVLTALVFGLIFGFVFKIVWSKISARKTEISKLFQNKAYTYGTASGITLSLIIQIVSYINYVTSIENFRSPPGVHLSMIWNWGFPFPIVYAEDFNLGGLIANILVTIIFSILLGLIFKFVWSKIAEMKKNVYKNPFLIGFVFTLSSFIFASALRYVYTFNYPYFRQIGFPMTFLKEFVSDCPWSPCSDFGINQSFVFYEKVFVIDVSIAIICSVVFGLTLKLIKFVWLKIAARKLK